jgi:hypothetical protein
MSFIKAISTPSITVYKYTKAKGPFSRQLLRLTPEGGGCFILLFIQILSRVVAYGPDLNGSTMLM